MAPASPQNGLGLVTNWNTNLQLGQPFNGLEWPQDSQDPQGLDGVDVLAFGPSVQI